MRSGGRSYSQRKNHPRRCRENAPQLCPLTQPSLRSPERVAKQFEKEVIKTSDAIFSICDKNQDGAIDRKEFLMCLEPKSDKDTSPKCIEIAKILSLFEGGSLKQWNALGKFIEVNGAMPSESDYTTTTSEAVKIEAFTEDAPRSRSPTMSPGCNQQ